MKVPDASLNNEQGRTSVSFNDKKNIPDTFFVKEDYGIVILEGFRSSGGRKRGGLQNGLKEPHAAKKTVVAAWGKRKVGQLLIISAIWKATSRLCSALRRGSQVVR
jgi:hypothetical protein